MDDRNRRSYHVYLTPLGREYADRLSLEFARIEQKALEGFSGSEAGQLQQLLSRVYNNMTKTQKEGTNK
jgi:DNA-binding MarR family transcriptional regulator